MKKIVLVLSIIFLVSCNNDENLDIQNSATKVAIEDAPLSEQIAYTHEHLLNIGKVVSKLYQNKDFKTLLFEEVNKRSNEGYDDEILVTDLLEKMEIKKTNLSSNTKKVLTNSVEAFYDIEGQDWEPSISIFNFDKKYLDFLNNSTNKVFDPTKPVIVASVEDVDDPIGYQEDDEGELKETDFLVTEEVAENLDEVIIIRLTTLGCIDLDGIQQRSNCGGTGGTTSTVDYLKVGRMKVKHHKESWHNGKSELHIRGYWDTEYNRYQAPGEFYTYYNDDPYGKRLKKFKRSWIGSNGNTKTLNSKILWDWDTVDNLGNTKSIYNFVIFEYDSWPAPNNTAQLPPLPDGTIRSVYYRSWQGEYKKDIVKLHNSSSNFPHARNYHINKNSIEFNFFRDVN